MKAVILKYINYRPQYKTHMGLLKRVFCWQMAKRRNLSHAQTLFSNSNNKNNNSNQPYFISTPIFYVNSVPHIGHLYTSVLADVITRWKKLKHQNVLFSTGTDEHGLKIQQAAEINNKSPQSHCDHISEKFKKMFTAAQVDYTDFIRTTEDRHKHVVHHFWNCLQNRGYIYKGAYEGWYSTSDETFVTDDLVTSAKNAKGETIQVFVESGQPVEWIKEENYMFALPKFREDLLHWLKGEVIHPVKFKADVRRYVNESLPELSVSRSRSRLHWGIPVPNDPSQTIYVWLDALTNYLTVGGYPGRGHVWPADCHIVGKDILKFHAVYWPAFLLAAGLEPPRQILCHSHWLVDGTKMSKSRGNVVDPVAAVDQYTSDGVRYFLMREGVLHSDGNFQQERVVQLLNSELANTLGNLLSRCVSAKINPSGRFPGLNEQEIEVRGRREDREMWHRLRELPEIVDTHYEHFEVNKAIESVMSQLRATNNFLEFHRPWELVKNPAENSWLTTVLHVTMETLRVAAILLGPVVPKLSGNVLDKLQISESARDFDSAKTEFKGDVDLNLSPSGLVFPRLLQQ